MKQFTITHLLLASTWLVIAIVVALPYFRKQPFSERMVNLPDLSVEDYDVKTQFDAEQIERSPSWNANTPNPPLSAGRALNIAETFRQENLTDFRPHPQFDTHWKIECLGLRSLDSKTNKWCWEVAFVCDAPPAGFIIEVIRRRIFIDMNGEIFQTTEIPPPDIEIPQPANDKPEPKNGE